MLVHDGVLLGVVDDAKLVSDGLAALVTADLGVQEVGLVRVLRRLLVLRCDANVPIALLTLLQIEIVLLHFGEATHYLAL